MLNTLISGCTSSVLSVYLKPHIMRTYSYVTRYDCVASCSGFVAGLVGVSGCCDEIEPWAALTIGIISSIMYMLGCKLLKDFHIDDPVEAVPMCLFCGIWGTLATGFFDNKHGLFYNSPNKGSFFGYQILGMLAIILWTSLISTTYFLIMKRLGKFRIDKSIEIVGLDIAEMGGLSNELFEKIKRDGSYQTSFYG